MVAVSKGKSLCVVMGWTTITASINKIQIIPRRALLYFVSYKANSKIIFRFFFCLHDLIEYSKGI